MADIWVNKNCKNYQYEIYCRKFVESLTLALKKVGVVLAEYKEWLSRAIQQTYSDYLKVYELLIIVSWF